MFVASTKYTRAVDIKKLKFIYLAIERYANRKSKELTDLNILEVGCGPGGITFPLTSLGCQVRAFDIGEESLKFIKSKIERSNIKNLTVTLDNGYTFNDGKTYDIVIASEVFEHVLEPSKLAANITKRMTEGSYLIITTPNGYGPWEMKNYLNPINHLKRWNFLRRQFGKSPYVFGNGKDHCQFYTKKRLTNLFSEISLKLIRFIKSDSLLTFFPLLTSINFIGKFDTKLADILPYQFASGWYFVFEMENKS